MSSPLLTAKEVADLLGVPTSWVYQQSRAGRIPTVRLGRSVRALSRRAVIALRRLGYGTSSASGVIAPRTAVGTGQLRVVLRTEGSAASAQEWPSTTTGSLCGLRVRCLRTLLECRHRDDDDVVQAPVQVEQPLGYA